jgi:sugar phosphate isomerase/epimerase
MPGITIAAKCAPHREALSLVKEAGIEAVELYLSGEILGGLPEVIKTCKGYPLRYSIHAPNDVHALEKLAELSSAIGAEIAVFHNIYFDDEWAEIAETFKNTGTRACVENVSTALEPLRFMRRYGLGMCLDLEHLQIECAGVYDEGFNYFIKQASHVHLSGYIFGTGTWHTHIHHSPEHGIRLLNLLRETGYRGWVVSEAKTVYQTPDEFRGLKKFFDGWVASFAGAAR